MEIFKLIGTIIVENQDAIEAIEETTEKSKKTGVEFDNVDTRARKLSNGGFTILKGAAAQLVAYGLQKVADTLGNIAVSAYEYERTKEGDIISGDSL